MSSPLARPFLVVAAFVLCLVGLGQAPSQEVPPAGPGAPPTQPVSVQDAVRVVPLGVEVLARGPVHEAFATPLAEPRPAPAVPKQPPANLEEMPPDERPEGDVAWIAGYWAWDDDRQDFLWVSGCWRVKPDGKDWVPGYWREQGAGWQWVAGFWTAAAGQRQELTYYPAPPAAPNVAPPPPAATPDQFYVPGYWMWVGNHYAWRAGYWTRTRPGYVYVASHYRWTPSGYVFIPGYWDHAVSRRGLLYAPVVVNPVVVGPQFVYTPYYAVSDRLMLDAFFVRPAHGVYYFGDYYGPRYTALGFESSLIYSRRHYEPIVVYQRYEYRNNPRWFDVQVNLVFERHAGRAPVPPRTLVQQRTVVNNVTNVTNINNVTVNNNVTNVTRNVTNNVKNTTNVQQTTALAPARSVLAARGAKAVPVDATTRAQVKETTRTAQQAVALERRKVEAAPPALGAQNKPRVAALPVAATPPAARINAPAPRPAATALPSQGLTKSPAPAVNTSPPLTGNVSKPGTPLSQPPVLGTSKVPMTNTLSTRPAPPSLAPPPTSNVPTSPNLTKTPAKADAPGPAAPRKPPPPKRVPARKGPEDRKKDR
jgi:hypothetical protein